MKALLTALPCALLLFACGGSETEGATTGDDPAVTGTAAEAGFEAQNDIVTPSEAAADAERSITPDNADEELEKLKQEIEGDG